MWPILAEIAWIDSAASGECESAVCLSVRCELVFFGGVLPECPGEATGNSQPPSPQDLALGSWTSAKGRFI